MGSSFAKHDLNFLVDAIEKKLARQPAIFDRADSAPVGATGKVSGAMSVPDPVTVNVNGTMSVADYKACSSIMAVSQNVVQRTLIKAAEKAGVEASDALKNMSAWVQAYVDFPFPFFNFKDTQSNTYEKKTFSLTTDADVIESIVNIKNVPALKDAVIGALRKSEGNIASYAGTDQKFNYFGVITGYNETDIAIRLIKFQMNVKTTDAKSLCVTYAQTTLDTVYDTYQFVADKDLMIKMQAKVGDKLIEVLADDLLVFFEEFFKQALADYHLKIAGLLKKK